MNDNDGMFRLIATNDVPSVQKAKSQWVPIIPVPDDVIERPQTHRRHGDPSHVYSYRAADGALLGYVYRFDLKHGGKSFSGLVYCQHSGTKRYSWRWKNFTSPKPLYGLDLLAKHPERTVVVVEGEKAADALNGVTSKYVAITSPQGAKSADKADWTAVKGRHCIVWPDNDEPGQVYAEAVCDRINDIGGSVSIVDLPPDLEAGFDAADAVAAGWSEEEITKFLAKTRPHQAVIKEPDPESRHSPLLGKSKPKAKPLRDQMLELVEGEELWRCPNRNAYATVEVNGATENYAVRSDNFRDYLTERFYQAFGKVPGRQTIEDVLSALEAKARFRGEIHAIFRRVGHSDGKNYLDLGDEARTIIEIDQCDWRIAKDCNIKFLRSPSMRALPFPERGESIDLLRNHLNYDTDSDFKMLVAWLMGCLMSEGPYPILAIDGQQGSAKSTTARILRDCIDPATPPLRSLPSDERNLVIGAKNSWLSCYDNLSGMSGTISDALCRISTGGGFATRKLHTNDEEMIFDVRRPIMLNGIATLGNRPDLADRTIAITLPTIAPQDRKTEADLIDGFERDLPEILGALLAGVSSAMRHLPTTELLESGRMADFCKLVTAAETGLGWETGEFMRIYKENHSRTVRSVIEDEPVVVAILTLVEKGKWEGTATDLLGVLSEIVSDQIQRSRVWPKTASKLGKVLSRLAPALKEMGVEVTKQKSGKRSWRIHKLDSSQS